MKRSTKNASAVSQISTASHSDGNSIASDFIAQPSMNVGSSGFSYIDSMWQHIFRDLGMTNPRLVRPPDQKVVGKARWLDRSANGIPGGVDRRRVPQRLLEIRQNAREPDRIVN